MERDNNRHSNLDLVVQIKGEKKTEKKHGERERVCERGRGEVERDKQR